MGGFEVSEGGWTRRYVFPYLPPLSCFPPFSLLSRLCLRCNHTVIVIYIAPISTIHGPNAPANLDLNEQ